MSAFSIQKAVDVVPYIGTWIETYSGSDNESDNKSYLI